MGSVDMVNQMKCISFDLRISAASVYVVDRLHIDDLCVIYTNAIGAFFNPDVVLYIILLTMMMMVVVLLFIAGPAQHIKLHTDADAVIFPLF